MKRIVVAVFLVSFLFSCTSIKQSKVYDNQKIMDIKTWSLEFMYEPGEISETNSVESNNETTVTRFGNYPILLGLKDDLFYLLKDSYPIKIKKDDEMAEGKILINPILFNSGQVLKVDITIFSSINEDDALARFQVEASIFDFEIEKACAKEIARVLNLL
ncbi:MAG: hypothetical protein GY756_17080 [bacterium]|nr:hypothetical protein [bacterium]